MSAYHPQDLREKIMLILGLSWYERDRMVRALEEAERKEGPARQAIIDAVVENLERRPAVRIYLRPQRSEDDKTL